MKQAPAARNDRPLAPHSPGRSPLAIETVIMDNEVGMLTKNSGGGVSTLIAPERVQCRTPSSNKKPKTIARWKFDALRKAILRVVPRRGDGLAISDLEPLVREQL